MRYHNRPQEVAIRASHLPLKTRWPLLEAYTRSSIISTLTHPRWALRILDGIRQQLLDGTRKVEDGGAPISWAVNPLQRLVDYARNGFPYMARHDRCTTIALITQQVLGVLPSMRIERWRDPWDNVRCSPVQLDGQDWSGVARGNSEYIRALCRLMVQADAYRWKQKAVPVKLRPAALEVEFPGAVTSLWWLAAKARWEAGSRYVVTYDDPGTPYTTLKDSRYSRYYQPKGIRSRDLLMDERLFDLSRDGWWLGKQANSAMVVADWAAPCMPDHIRTEAYNKFGWDDERLRYEPDNDKLHGWYLKHRDEVTKAMKSSHDERMNMIAYRKFGYTPGDRDSEIPGVAIKAVIKHGFKADQIADVNKLPRELQRLYIRYYGLACEAHMRADVSEELSGAVRRILRRGHQTYCKLSDLLAFGQPNEFFQEVIRDARPDSASELSGFFLVALDTIAAHPEIAIEYQIYLRAFISGTNLDYSSKLLDFAIQNRKGLEASRAARFDSQGLRGIAQKDEPLKPQEEDE